MNDTASQFMQATTIQLRVRYAECDPQNVAHHGSYAAWFELARTELLREQGVIYRDLESQGLYFVVARLNIRYQKPARYDDLLDIEVTTTRCAASLVEHRYEVRLDGQTLTKAESTLVMIDGQGKPTRIPSELAEKIGVDEPD